MRDVWDIHLSEKYQQNYRLPESMVQKLITEILHKVQQRKLYGSSALKKFRDFLIRQLCAELLEQVRTLQIVSSFD